MIKDTSIRLSQQVKYKQLPFVHTSVAWFDLGVWSEGSARPLSAKFCTCEIFVHYFYEFSVNQLSYS